MSGHDDVAADAERELEDLEQRTEQLTGEIQQARTDLIDNGGDTKIVREAKGAVGDDPEDADEPESSGTPKGWA